MLLFSGYIALILLHFRSRVPCSCGGILSGMPWSVHLLFNLCFTGLCIAGLYTDTSRASGRGKAENLRTE